MKSNSKEPDQESEFIQLVRERYDPGVELEDSNPRHMEYLFLLNAPEQYEVEPQMLEYAKAHPDVSVRDMFLYFHEIVPPGLPPCASEWDDDEDDD